MVHNKISGWVKPSIAKLFFFYPFPEIVDRFAAHIKSNGVETSEITLFANYLENYSISHYNDEPIFAYYNMHAVSN